MLKTLLFSLLLGVSHAGAPQIAQSELIASFVAPESFTRALCGQTDVTSYPAPLNLVKYIFEQQPDGTITSRHEVVSANGVIELPQIEIITLYEGTSKAQVLGLLTQLKNLMNNDTNTVSAMRSVTDLYGKKDEVIIELDALRVMVNAVNDEIWRPIE